VRFSKVRTPLLLQWPGWHKSPAVVGLKAFAASAEGREMHMKELGSCVGPISGEHIISESVIRVLMTEGDFSISGLPWPEASEERILAPQNLKANCLCVKHNSVSSSRRCSSIFLRFAQILLILMRILLMGYEHALRTLTAAKNGNGNGIAEFQDDFRRMAARGAASTVLALAENLPKIVDKSAIVDVQDVE
jgi:hypothetical protein